MNASQDNKSNDIDNRHKGLLRRKISTLGWRLFDLRNGAGKNRTRKRNSGPGTAYSRYEIRLPGAALRAVTLASIASIVMMSFSEVRAENVQNLSVENLHVTSGLTIGMAGAGVDVAQEIPAFLFNAESIAGATFATSSLAGDVVTWEWLRRPPAAGAPLQKTLSLNSTGCLTLYSPTTPTGAPAIVFDAGNPANAQIRIAGARVLTENSLHAAISSFYTNSIALGTGAYAASHSTAIGPNSVVEGTGSVAIGRSCRSTDNCATAIGDYATTSSPYAIAMGWTANASGRYAIALGTSHAQGDYSTGIGTGAYAASYSTAIGPNSVVEGTGSVAIGQNCRSADNCATAIGDYATTSSPYAIAMGWTANASGRYAIALGTSHAQGDYSTGIGSWNEARGNYSTVIGYESDANSDAHYSIAIGHYSSTEGACSTAIGPYAYAEGECSTAIGYSCALGFRSISLGMSSMARAYGTIAMGDGANASASTAIAIGASTQASGGASIAIGDFANVSGGSSTVIGASAKASGEFSTAIGYFANTTGSYSFSSGFCTNNTGNYSTAIGYCSGTSGDSSTAIGYYSNAGNGAVALGNNAGVYGEHATVIGYSTTSYSRNSITIGNGSWMDNESSISIGNSNQIFNAEGNSFALGNNILLNSSNQIALGFYNDPRPEHAFMIGNGEASIWRYDGNGNYREFGRSNLFTISRTGAVQLYHAQANSEGSDSNAESSSNAPVIELQPDPADPHILIAGARVLTEENAGGLLPSSFFNGNGGWGTAGEGLGLDSVAIGVKTIATGDRQTVLGKANLARDDALFIIGNGDADADGALWNPVSGVYDDGRANALVITNENKVQIYNLHDSQTPVMEFDPTDPGGPQIRIGGHRVLTELDLSSASAGGMGWGNFSGIIQTNSANESVAIGHASGVSGNQSVAVGNQAVAHASQSVAVGAGAEANGGGSAAIGADAWTSGANSIAIGTSSAAAGQDSIALGNGTLTYDSGQVALGMFNEARPEYAFMIGNGSHAPQGGAGGAERSNLFVITREGKGIFRHVNFAESTPGNAAPVVGGEALHVKGNARIEGTLRLRPAGDLPMGPFVSDEAEWVD
ncbi:MAG: hypothetical protein LBG65_07775 [Puniceicoccales bacterium]|jgi:hypothetical protein|nr:hypothetical protein [Puniceicoccales bacterium]